MFTGSTYDSVTKPQYFAVAEAILQSNTEGNVACLSEPNPAGDQMILDQSIFTYKPDTKVLLDFLSCSPRFAEGLYCFAFNEE